MNRAGNAMITLIATRSSGFAAARSCTLSSIAVAALLLADADGTNLAKDSAGCVAVNAGALDLGFQVDASGVRTGVQGSGFVGGFAEGDVLTFAQKAAAGSAPLVQQLRLAAADWESNLLFTVFVLKEHVVPRGNEWALAGVTYAIPARGKHWSIFTTTSSEGVGEYKVTVRCEHGLVADNAMPHYLAGSRTRQG
jgi:hypothetical protein